mgnify:CR=1 FL=1
MHGAGDGFDGGGVLQRDVVRQFVDYGGRRGELFGKTAVARDTHGGKMVAQFGTLGQAVLTLTAVDVRIDGHAVATLTPVTSEPMAATTPEFSWPSTIGGTAAAEPGRPAYRS